MLSVSSADQESDNSKKRELSQNSQIKPKYTTGEMAEGTPLGG